LPAISGWMVLPWLCSTGGRWLGVKTTRSSDLLVMECLERLGTLLLLLQSPAQEGRQGLKLLQELRSVLCEVHLAVDDVLCKRSPSYHSGSLLESAGSRLAPMPPAVCAAAPTTAAAAGGSATTAPSSGISSQIWRTASMASETTARGGCSRAEPEPPPDPSQPRSPPCVAAPGSPVLGRAADAGYFPDPKPPQALQLQRRLRSDRSPNDGEPFAADLATSTATSSTGQMRRFGREEEERTAPTAEVVNSKGGGAYRMLEGEFLEAEWRGQDWSCADAVEERAMDSNHSSPRGRGAAAVAAASAAAAAGALAGVPAKTLRQSGPLSRRMPRRSLPGLPSVPEAPRPTRRDEEEAVDEPLDEIKRARQVAEVRKLLRAMVDSNMRLPSDPPLLSAYDRSQPASSSRTASSFREMFGVCSAKDISIVAPDCLVYQARNRQEVSVLGGLPQAEGVLAPWLQPAPNEGAAILDAAAAAVAAAAAGKAGCNVAAVKGAYDTDSDDEDAEATCQRYVTRQRPDGTVCWAPAEAKAPASAPNPTRRHF